MNPSSDREAIRGKLELTGRDIRLLLLIGEGLLNKQIADQLDLSIKTLEFHKRRLYTKIGVNGSVGAVRFAIREGYMQA